MKSRIYYFRRVVLATCLCLSLGGMLLNPADVVAAKFNKAVDVGQVAPAWKELIGTDDKRHSLSDFKNAKAIVVVFTCNHCPVAKAYEERILKLAEKYRKEDVQFVAISVSLIETDLLPEMKKRAADKKYPFPYLHDSSQKVGRAYGATATPQVFLLNSARKITYMGKIDDEMHADRVTESFLDIAIRAALDGKEPDVTETKPVGCPIQYE